MIVLIDYGMANLRSVQKALERVGHSAEITDNPGRIAEATKIILPGVGASADALRAVRERGLEGPIKEAVNAGKPFLGICLGLQMLFDKSYEDGEHQGLGLLPGKTIRFDLPSEFKVPHMGWNQIQIKQHSPIFEGIAKEEHFYFVHSYFVVPDDASVISTETDYGGPFCSSVCHGNLYATQFHPEKSQAAGLKLLKNFAELAQ